MVPFHILRSNELILSATIPRSAGAPRAVKRAEQKRGALNAGQA